VALLTNAAPIRGMCSCTVSPKMNLRAGVSVFLLGGIAGGLGSLVGLGGAFIIIPVLSGPIGLSPHHAIGTSMAAVLATSLGATASYSRSPSQDPSDTAEIGTRQAAASPRASPSSLSSHILGVFPRHIGLVDVSAALSIIIFSTCFAVVGARLSKKLHEQGVRQAQGVLMMAIAPSLLVSDHLKSSDSHTIPSSSSSSPASPVEALESKGDFHDIRNELSLSSVTGFVLGPATQRLALVGTFSGLAAGFFGIGGGAVTVPALVYLLDFDYRTALATSLVVMVPTSMTGAAAHLLQKTMLLPFALPLSLGTAGGAYVGGNFSRYVDDKKLKQLFAVTMLTLGLRTFLKAARR